MSGLLDLLKKNLSLKIVLSLTFSSAMVMGVVIFLSIFNQKKQITDQMMIFGRELSYMAYAGIKHPMSIGDSPSVKRQFLDVKEVLLGTEIVICDFNQQIIFATHENRISREITDFINNDEALSALNMMLELGTTYSEKYFEEQAEGKRYLVTIHPMENSEECHHCHGETRKMLGGLVIKQSTDATYGAITSLRDQTIFISVLGIAALIILGYFLLLRLVTRPVEELANKAEKLAQGDLSVSVPVKAKDSIGILGESFNYMVSSIRDQIEFANSLKMAIADPLFIVDTNMIITYMNESCSLLTGFSKEETEGKLLCQDIFQSDKCDSSCPIKNSFKKDKPVNNIRVTMRNREGRHIPLIASASLLKDAKGALVGGVEICRDISDVIEAERLLYIEETAVKEEEQRRNLENRAENLLKVVTKVSEGNLTVRAEVTERNEVMDEIALHTNHMLDNLEKLYERISSFSKELELEVARRTMMLREKTLLLERANRELRELDRLKSSFLANMSHELRTPMNSIIGYTELLLDGVDGTINEEQAKSLKKVDNNAKHLLQLINDILDMSKIESGKMELELRKINIQTLVETVAATFEPPITKKRIALSYNFDKEFLQVYVDEDKVRQVLMNLFSNAVKFTHQGGITISTAPSDRGIKPGEPPLFLQVSIEDTGIGIQEKDLEKLFDKFSQIDDSTIRQYEGTGLGLSIARGMVVLHKGMIWAESKYGKGTIFHFTLPIRKEILDKPDESMLELMMAEGLASCFGKPVETFLNFPQYGGKQIRCWEYTHCGQTSCPAYGSNESRCWLIYGTHCKGTMVASYPEKVEFCKGCEIIERVILDDYETKEAKHIAESIEAKGETGKRTVLAIDDNAEAIEIIKKYLGEEYNVVGLLDAEQAVSKAAEIKPIAISLDILMPKKDGWQVLQELKTSPETQDIPVIILSIIDDKKQGFSLGATEYLLKPIDKKLLLRKLKNLEKVSRIKRVLVVDSDPRTVELTGHILDEAGYKIKTADNNENAIKLMKETMPDLIVFDLTMPDSSDVSLIEFIKSDKEMKNTPLIVITGKDLTEKEVALLDGKIQAVLKKGLLAEESLLKEFKETIHKCEGL